MTSLRVVSPPPVLCRGDKIRHASRLSADLELMQVEAIERGRFPRRAARLNVYYCGPCRAWHVGHRKWGA